MRERSGGRILVEALQAEGVKKVFCVPGESYLDALDALVDAPDVRVVTCRHEGGAAFMAEAYAKLTGHVGVCFVTRGPGACNASIGVHTARQDSTPMVLLAGQVARDMKGREAFQEVDYDAMFGTVAKWTAEAQHASDLPQLIRRAFEEAKTGRPGPAIIALPEDVLTELSDAAIVPPQPVAHFAPKPQDMAKVKEILSAAKKPLVVLGGGCWTDAATAAMEAFCARVSLPVAVSFRRQDAFSNQHDSYVGALGTTLAPSLAAGVKEADVLLVVGSRLGEIPTQGYKLVTPPVPRQKLVHVYPDATELNKVYKAELAVHSSAVEFTNLLQELELDGEKWEPWRAQLRKGYLDWRNIPSRDKYTLDVDGVIEDILSVLPEDAILTTDAGNFSSWAQRHVLYKRPMRLLAPTCGAMGYSVPAGVAASLTHPDRAVISFVGDGGFLMTGQEIATAMQAGAHPVILLFNNNMYGTIRMHQERDYPGRVKATDLTNPDFAAWAESFGARGYAVEKNEDFLPVFKEALQLKKPVVIELRMNGEQIVAGKTMAEVRGK